VPCGTPVFETGTIGHSVTSPIAGADDRSHAAAAPSLCGAVLFLFCLLQVLVGRTSFELLSLSRIGNV
ncbi:MAG: hypothetical protein O3B68_20315, partial [Planctomycetota bacterium]|nr:hypothetical protein [Planctomycetota bacterium]